MNPFDYIKRRILRRSLRISGKGTDHKRVADEVCKVNDYAHVGAMYISTVNRCINLIAGGIASMPVHYQCKSARGVFEDEELTDIYRLLRYQPNERMSAFEFWRVAMRRMLLDGVVYAVPVKENGKIAKVCLVFQATGNNDGSRRGHVYYNRERKTYTINDREQGLINEVLSEAEILVFRAQSPDGIEADSIIKFARDAINRAAAGNDESLTRISNGGQSRVFLQDEDTFAGVGDAVENGRKEASDRINDAYSRDRLVTVLPRGYKLIQGGASSVDMQLQGMREFDVKDICRFFGVPPQYVFSDSSSNYKSAEMASVDFMVNALEPILQMIENELLRKLTPAGRWSSERFRFEREARMAMDSDTRGKYYSQMLSIGAMTPNEIRKQLNQEPVDGGDTALVSANLRTINDISSQNQQ